MNLYYIQSGWREGVVVARNTLHALDVARNTCLHKTGSPVFCLPIDKRCACKELKDYLDFGPGRILLPTLFRRTFIFVNPTN